MPRQVVKGVKDRGPGKLSWGAKTEVPTSCQGGQIQGRPWQIVKGVNDETGPGNLPRGLKTRPWQVVKEAITFWHILTTAQDVSN